LAKAHLSFAWLFQKVIFYLPPNIKTTNAYAFLMVSLSIVGWGRKCEKSIYIDEYQIRCQRFCGGGRDWLCLDEAQMDCESRFRLSVEDFLGI